MAVKKTTKHLNGITVRLGRIDIRILMFRHFEISIQEHSANETSGGFNKALVCQRGRMPYYNNHIIDF